MEWKKAAIGFLKRFLAIFLGLVIFRALVDLWDPMKKMVNGDKLPLNEIMTYLQFKGHWSVIIAISIGVSISGFRRHLKNPSRQSDQRPTHK